MAYDRFPRPQLRLNAETPDALQAPYILWDTRAYTGDQIVHNSGSGGSLFNLPLSGFALQNPVANRRVAGSIPSGWGAHRYKGSAPNTNWAAIGGDPCTATFTMMVAFADVSIYDTTMTAPDNVSWKNDGVRVAQVGWHFSPAADYHGVRHLVDVYRVNTTGTPPGSQRYYVRASIDITATPGVPTSRVTWQPDTSHPGENGQPEMSFKLLTMTLDCRTRTAWVWLDGVLQRPPRVAGYWNFDTAANLSWICTDDAAAITDAANPRFSGGIGFHAVPYLATDPKPGISWAGIVGAAMFRGTPNAADLADWRTYWFPGGQVYYPMALTSPAPFTTTVTRSGSNTAAHTSSFTVPTRATFPITRLAVNVIPSIGSNGPWNGPTPAGNDWFFWMDVAAGDTIETRLGGGGSDFNTGTGGWPDGGQGGQNTAAPFPVYGGGGGGSTRIYRNGTLMAQIAGSGGVSYSVPSNNTNTAATGGSAGIYGGTVAAPLATDGVDSGTIGTTFQAGLPGTAAGGGGGGSGGAVAATAGTATAGGTGCGTNGSIATVGLPGSFTYGAGGGGGGGGVFGGGGGGRGTQATTAGAASGGGGAGANWFHPTLVVRGGGTVSASSPSQFPGTPASVTFYE